jgi:dolichyl-phosphate-mannose-protein mannosyltransferase
MSEAATFRRESMMSRDAVPARPAEGAVRAAAAWPHWLSPAGIVALLLVVSAPLYFMRGIGIFDDSLHLKIGQLIVDGFTPYRDFYDNKPPGLYYVSAAIAAVGGRGWLAPRIFLFLFAALFQIGVVRWLQQQFGVRAATIAAVFLGLSYPLCQGYSLHTEPFGAAAAFAACAVLLRGPASLGRWAIAGALLGLATTFKQTGVLYVGGFAAFAVFNAWRRRDRTALAAARIAWLSGAFGLALVPVALAFAVQGLGRAMFDAVVTDVMLRVDGAESSLPAIRDTWQRCPALVAFLGVAVLLAGSRRTRQVMDERRRDAFALFAFVGVISILPTLKLNGAGHYLQPGAFALAAACAIFLDDYLRGATLRSARLVGTLAIMLMAAYFVVLGGASAAIVWQNRIGSDLTLQQQLRETLDTKLDPNEPVLCVSASSAARLYLMSGRKPFNRSLYFYPNVDRLFSLEDARRVLFEGLPAAAVVDIDPKSTRPEFYDNELNALRTTYEVIPLGPQTNHLLLALVRYRRNAEHGARP